MKKRRKLIAFSIIFWVIVNFASLAIFTEEWSRWARFASSFFFLILIVFQKPFSWKFLFIYLLFAICDFGLIYFENPYFNNLTYVSRVIAFILVAALGFLSLKRIKFSKLELIIGPLIIAINLFLLNQLDGMMEDNHVNALSETAFYTFAVVTIITMIAAVSYSNRFGSNKSLFYLCGVLWMVCSDLTFFIAYYLNFEVFYYPDRFFNVMGSGFLALFAISFHNEYELDINN